MSFYEQNIIVLSQNSLLNHAANCEILRKNISNAKYFAKCSKPCYCLCDDNTSIFTAYQFKTISAIVSLNFIVKEQLKQTI